MITDPLYVDIETTEWNTNATGPGYKPARGNSNVGGRRCIWCPDNEM